MLPEYHKSRFGSKWQQKTSQSPNLARITQDFPKVISTAAYVIASDGTTTTIFEKDRASSTVSSSQSFIVITNHDQAHENPPTDERAPQEYLNIPGLAELLEESVDRKAGIEKRWRSAHRRFMNNNPGALDEDVFVSQATVEKWLVEYPITNETTHFAAIMDPKEGQVAWLRNWIEPVE
jgi:hypothetical protein